MSISYWRLRDNYYRLLGSICNSCKHESFPKFTTCMKCNSTNISEKEMPNTGKIISYTLSYEAMPEFENQLPMSIGLIKLENGQIVKALQLDQMVENMLVNFIRESFTGMELTHKMVENMWDNIKIIKDTVKELTHMLMEINTLGNGKNINTMGKAFTYMPTEINMLENGKSTNTMEKELIYILMEINTLENGKRTNILLRTI